jgi:hypothetical protein
MGVDPWDDDLDIRRTDTAAARTNPAAAPKEIAPGQAGNADLADGIGRSHAGSAGLQPAEAS